MAPLVNLHACSTVPLDPPAMFTGERAAVNGHRADDFTVRAAAPAALTTRLAGLVLGFRPSVGGQAAGDLNNPGCLGKTCRWSR